MENCRGPSKFHLKRELTVLSRSNVLRDPETCPSWRSPLSSRSSAAITNYLNHAHGNRNATSAYKSSGTLELGQKSTLTSRSGYRRKQTYLYNWGCQSSKSSGSVMKLHRANRKETAQDDMDDRLTNCNEVMKNTASIPHSKGRKSETPMRKIRNVSAHASPKWPVVRNLAKTMFLDLPSGSSEFLNSAEPSDDTECCHSNELQHKMQELIGNDRASHVGTPLLSASGSGNWLSSHEYPKNREREESSCSLTPVSAGSHNIYKCLDGVGSWYGIREALEGDTMYLPGRQACGIPRFSSKGRKERGCKGWYSPSISDKIRRKGSRFICGSQTANHKRRKSNAHKTKTVSKSVQVLPLLSSSYDGGSSSTKSESDEILTKFGEIEMEALNQLDRKGWSNCRTQDGIEVISPVCSCEDTHKNVSLDWKYRPKIFEEIIGQNIVIQSLKNAIFKGRIAPAYLFQGPRGTGKTSCARIFAAALNCSSIEDQKPCGFCRECTEFASGFGSCLEEIDSTDERSIDKFKYLMKNFRHMATSTQYNVIIIDQCHMMSYKMLSVFIKFLEEPPPHIVFIFVTVDPDNLPHAVVSRCQKYLFSKIRDFDMVSRLQNLATEEGLDVEVEALNLIAVNSDGSMRDAEMMLDQLSLLGRRITSSLVSDFVGVISDEKLLDLLEIAMSSDAAETVRRSRELLDSGVNPMALMAQLATLIMDIIAGSNQLSSSNSGDSVLHRLRLNEAELGRLHQALKVLSDSEKQLRHSSECSTWFTAALLQLGSGSSTESLFSSGGNNSSSHNILKTGSSDLVKGPSVNDNQRASLKLQNEHSSSIKELQNRMGTSENMDFGSEIVLPSNLDDKGHRKLLECSSPDMLNGIWRSCIKGCHSKSLRNLLSNDGKLVSILDVGGELVACISFRNANTKSRAERFLNSITNSLETVLKYDVKVRIDLLTDKHGMEPSTQNKLEENGLLTKERQLETTKLKFSSNKLLQDVSHNQPGGSGDYRENELQRREGFHEVNESSKEVHGSNDAVEYEIARKVLENAWLQAVEGGRLGSSEKNQILPQDGIINQNNSEHDNMEFATSSKHWTDELSYEIRTLQAEGKDRIGEKINNQVFSPSTLHTNKWSATLHEDNEGDDSGPGCNGLLCWKTKKLHREKGKQGNTARSRKILSRQ